MDTIADSSRIFKEIADRFGVQPISGSTKLNEFFVELLARTRGLVILDFLDQSNWDSIEAFHLNQESGILTLTWHDYRETQESAKDREHRQIMFPASLHASALQVNTIVPIVGTASAVFLINAYAKTEKEIRAVYKKQAEEFELLDNSFFEKRVVRKIAGQWEIIDFHCTPIFSMAIVPKRSGITPLVSKKILYQYNFATSLDRLNRVVVALNKLDPNSDDEIAEKVNTVRRIMEFVLKVECCSRGLAISKNYSQVRLGDLIALVKRDKEASIQTLLEGFAEMANEFSHDSGKPVELPKAKRVAQIGLTYATLVEMEHRHGG